MAGKGLKSLTHHLLQEIQPATLDLRDEWILRSKMTNTLNSLNITFISKRSELCNGKICFNKDEQAGARLDLPLFIHKVMGIYLFKSLLYCTMQTIYNETHNGIYWRSRVQID